jgi:hypothetical protein
VTWLCKCVVSPPQSTETYTEQAVRCCEYDGRKTWLWKDEAKDLFAAGWRVYVCDGWGWDYWTDDNSRAWHALLTDLEQREASASQPSDLQPHAVTL